MLYNKYRPKYFKDLIGQELTKDLLISFLTSKENIHSFIFFGQNGTGKTTAARLFSQAINCTKFQELKELCRECDFCKLIEREKCTDIIEIDGATHNGVEYIREVIKNSIYPPLLLNKKVYIVDEAHCLSYQSWNALLKLIEEPPSHLILIFLTTAINKIIPTILSRCQKLFFSPIKVEELNKLLQSVSIAENKEINSEIISKLSENSSGSAREAIVSLEKVLLNSQSSNDLINSFSELKDPLELLSLIFNSKYKKAIEKVTNKLTNSNKLFELILDKLLELSFYQLSSSKEVLYSISEEEARDLLKNTPNLSAMINFLAPALSSSISTYNLSYSKFLLVNLFDSCFQPLYNATTKEVEIPKSQIKLKKEESTKTTQASTTEKKVQTHESLSLGTLLTEAIVQKSKVESLPDTKDLFQHLLIKFENVDLPEFKNVNQILLKEREIILQLRQADKAISKDNYSLLKNYLESEDDYGNCKLVITKLFKNMLSKYELVCSKDSSCIVVFPDESKAHYFNLKVKNLSIMKELYRIFDSSIYWRAITLSELQIAINKNKHFKFDEMEYSVSSKRDSSLLQKIKGKFLNEKTKFVA